jgi:hypothetical protein
MVARALIGLGVAVGLMAGLKAIVLWFPPERVALANGWYIMLGALGALSATGPAEVLVQGVGWRGLFAILAASTAAVALLILLVVPVNKSRSEASSIKATMRRELERIDRQIKRLVEVILEGGDAKAINVKLKELEAEKSRLTRELATSPNEEPLLHPNLAMIYRTRVDALEALFRDAEEGREAFEMLRGLIEEVRIIPEDGEYRLELKGELAGILALAQGAKNSERAPAQRALQIKVVAGARNHFLVVLGSSRSYPALPSRTIAIRINLVTWDRGGAPEVTCPESTLHRGTG